MFSIKKSTHKTLAPRKQPPRDRELMDRLGAIELGYHPLVVDYNADINKLVLAGGYRHISNQAKHLIAKNLFLRSIKHGQETLSVVRIQFGREMSLHSAGDLIYATGLRLTWIMELLHWGITYPKQQQKFPIVAPGAIARTGESCLVFLDGDSISGRDLASVPLGSALTANTRFLAIDPSPL